MEILGDMKSRKAGVASTWNKRRPDSTFSDRVLRLFLEGGILAHVGIDHAEPARLSEVYIGETDRLELALE